MQSLKILVCMEILIICSGIKTHPLRVSDPPPLHSDFSVVGNNQCLPCLHFHPPRGRRRENQACLAVSSCCPAACNVTPGCIRCSAPRLASCSLAWFLFLLLPEVRSLAERRGPVTRTNGMKLGPRVFSPRGKTRARSLQRVGRFSITNIVHLSKI